MTLMNVTKKSAGSAWRGGVYSLAGAARPEIKTQTKAVITGRNMTPFPAKTAARLMDRWVEEAKRLITVTNIEPNETYEIARNKLINKTYGEIYLSNPVIYKWAGMAAFASYSAGEKLKLLRDMSLVGVAASRFRREARLLLAIPGWNIAYMYDRVATGNNAIFEDMGWQHLAYAQAGMEEITRIYRQGDIPEDLYNAWQMIDRGRRSDDDELIWTGNATLLEHEQKYVIQPVLYEGWFNVALWKLISVFHTFTGLLLDSPVPGGAVDFRHAVPGGNLASFDDRWKWCIEMILPAWKGFEQAHRDEVAQKLAAFGARVTKPLGLDPAPTSVVSRVTYLCDETHSLPLAG